MYLTSGENEGQTDPHAWLSVVNGIQYVENAKNALIKIDPDHQAEYEENAARYIKELKALHEEIKEKYAQIPKEKRILVSSEGAFLNTLPKNMILKLFIFGKLIPITKEHQSKLKE